VTEVGEGVDDAAERYSSSSGKEGRDPMLYQEGRIRPRKENRRSVGKSQSERVRRANFKFCTPKKEKRSGNKRSLTDVFPGRKKKLGTRNLFGQNRKDA